MNNKIKLTESQLRNLIAETVMETLAEEGVNGDVKEMFKDWLVNGKDAGMSRYNRYMMAIKAAFMSGDSERAWLIRDTMFRKFADEHGFDFDEIEPQLGQVLTEIVNASGLF